MIDDLSKQLGKLVSETLDLKDLEMEVERRRLEVSRMRYELAAVVGIDARWTVPVSRSVQ